MPRYTHPVVLTHSVAAKWAGLERWRDIDVLAAKAPVMEKVVSLSEAKRARCAFACTCVRSGRWRGGLLRNLLSVARPPGHCAGPDASNRHVHSRAPEPDGPDA